MTQMLNQDSKYCIYVLLDGKEVFYVDKTLQNMIACTLWRHENINNNKHKFNKIKRMLNQGKKLQLKVVKTELTEIEAFQLETFLIVSLSKFGFKLVNLTNGGEGASGYKHSIEECKKRSNRMKNQNPMFRVNSKQKLSLKKSKPVSQYTLNGVFIKTFLNAKIAAKELNIFRQNIVSCCQGKTKYSGGFVWRYHVEA
jgi:hypothetical protein